MTCHLAHGWAVTNKKPFLRCIVTRKGYFTFATTHQAIKAESALAKKSFEYKMVPVPRSISSSCGIALCCPPGEALAIRGFLEECSVSIEGYYELEEKIPKNPLSFLYKRRS
ncbi:MAG TPA: DUF3343 domain-containing protein [Firmicutes bacterium]|jgi:hypothetical protein|nr:DUF3343 domain-containing protein [Bacillota bacterium]